MLNDSLLAKLIASALILAIIITAVSCADSGTAEETSSDTVPAETEAEATDSLQARQLVSDNLPDTDCDGRSFRTLTQTEYDWDMWVPEITGDIVEDAIYERDARMQERFNFVVVESEVGEYDAISSRMRKSVSAGDDEFDMYIQHMIQAGIDAQQGIFLDWYDVDYVNFSQPWYPSFAIEGLTVNNTMFLCVGDMLLAAIDRTYCMIYDKNAAADNGITNIAELSINGGWTVDQLITISKQVYSDLNGDGKKNDGDYFGFTSPTQNNTTPYYYSFDIPRMDVSEDYVVTLTINNERMVGAVELLRELFNSDGTWSGTGAGMTEFRLGGALITSATIGDTLNNLRDYENDYGVIPYPKYDEAQENYYTIMGGGVSTMCIPMTVTDTSFVGLVSEAMCADTWKNVIPQYYDIALKVKGTRDEESITVMDMLLDGRAVDIALAYDGWEGFSYKLNELITSTQEWSSFYAKKEAAVTKHYQKIIDLFMEYNNG